MTKTNGLLATLLAFACASLLLPTLASADVAPHGGMIRFPAVSAESIVFHYAGDLWIVDRDGGLARPVAGPAGLEFRPRFSPDGRSIAFVGNYDGDQDLYVIGVDGGVARRVTHHPAGEILLQWTRDGDLLFASSATGAPRGNRQLFRVDAEGGLPERLPVVYGAVGSISDDGRWLAFTPHTRDHRTWKRYRGGMATDIWLYDLRNGTAEQITDWEGTDTEPMWFGSTIYYVSDAGKEHRWNLWSYDTRSKERRQVTRFSDYDVKMPSIGPGPEGKGEIVFQLGSAMRLLDLATGKDRSVEIRVPGDRPELMPHRVDASGWIMSHSLSSTGKRILVEMRGDVWSMPSEEGVPVNLTRSSGAAERTPTWSPDGRWIAYFSDASGEYQLHVRASDGSGEPRQVGKLGAMFKMWMEWAPDSESLAYMDKTGTLYVVDVESGKRTLVHADLGGGEFHFSWSHDSKWIAYDLSQPNLQTAIALYDVEKDTHHRVTAGFFNDNSATFDRDGDFLYYASMRDFSAPTYEDVGTTFVYDATERILMVPLRDDVEIPGLPKEDLETWDDEDGDDAKAEDEDDSDDEDEDADEEDAAPMVVDLEDFEARAMALDIPRGNFGALAVVDGGALVYVRFTDREASIKIYDPSADEPEEKTVLDGFRRFDVSADGKKLLVRRGDSFAVIDAAADQKFEDPVSAAGLETVVDPRQEWAQIFDDAWRIMRDFFYDPNMHGVDWKKVKKQYSAMLADCSSRADVAYVIREMISELNVGHAYHFGGDIETGPNRNVGLLGVDFELDRGAYRIAKVYAGAAWDSDARSPLDDASGEIGVGDYILAVNGVEIDTALDPWAAFVGTADKVTRLTVSSEPKRNDETHDVLVEPVGSEASLRYRHWIEEQRAHVEAASDGKVGYIYVPNTGRNGQNDLFRQFYGQRDKLALIIDERWNGGGQIPTRFVELLNRPITNYWAIRDGSQKAFPWPIDANQGAKCMLINGLAGSGGDAFPAYFRQAGLGKLIGERTWGGLVGISGGPALVDGAFLSAPSFAYYELDGTWGIEGHGVDPDIEVVADPAKLAAGVDPQLEAAIALMLEEIQANPYRIPPVPAYPDRSGMGLPDADH